ncbi:MAG TPA: class I SAM-dependent methyltransferase [Polyangia bacterium]|nr:class I SAM-dependent methyltransferase [Polyangia bacterium]
MDERARRSPLRTLLSARAAALAARGDDASCVRVCAGLADGVPGLLVDRFGPLVVAIDYASSSDGVDDLLRVVRACFPGHHVIVKTRASASGGNQFQTAAFHQPDRALPLIAEERGLRFELGLDPAHDFGLFLDAAKARAYVREHAHGARVLNLFSYTGAFGIAAAAAGAIDVVNVDPNRDYLAWSLRNAALNGVAMRVLPDTAQDYLGKHLRRRARDPQHPAPDLVIVDPPAFGVGRGNERVLRLLWPQLFEALRAMAPGRLVLMCNDKAFRSRRGFADVVDEELGALYRFQRLGTHFSLDELAAPASDLAWSGGVEDPHYVEPVVLVGEWAG